MKKKTINAIVSKKINDWLSSLMKKPPKVYAGPVAVLVDGSC
jgi:hypothetical protein